MDESGASQKATEEISRARDEAAISPLPQTQVQTQLEMQPHGPIGRLASHPAVKGWLGKSIKIVAGMAILGCLLLWAAVTALSTILGNALPH